MKDLKSLKPTEICIRATEENAEFIVSLLEKLGGIHQSKLTFESGDFASYPYVFIDGGCKNRIDAMRLPFELTEITLEQLRELAGVKEPQTERITLKDTGWMPTFREEANEHLKQLLTFQTDLNEHINSVVQKLATLEAVKSENESLKKERDELKSCLNYHFEDLFRKHIEFSSKTFLNSSWQSSLIGLRREIEEVEAEIPKGDENAIAVEYADCFLYLLDSMNRAGISVSQLKDAIHNKIEINTSREWKQNKDGSYSHIKNPFKIN